LKTESESDVLFSAMSAAIQGYFQGKNSILKIPISYK